MLDLLEVAYPTPVPADSASARSTLVLSSISTDGKINLYDLSALSVLSTVERGATPVEIGPIASHDTDGSRLTCVCAIGLVGPIGAAGTSGLEGEEDEEEEESESEEEEGGDSEESDGSEGEDKGEEEIAFESEDEAEYEDE